MKLENIGFYTLEDFRARNTSINSPLWRCELILTDACNFKCPYCRGLRPDISGTMSYEKARNILDFWISGGLRNVRFSGGEPTLYKHLPKLIFQAKKGGIRRIAISTNGSASLDSYKELAEFGVNDFSISLDACCSSTGDIMAGRSGIWEKVVENIAEIAKFSYTTVGIVLVEETKKSLGDIIRFASGLGVADIRIISAAQMNNMDRTHIPEEILKKHPILAYRIGRMNQGKNVRGMCKEDNSRCPLVIDDMAIAGDYHFPCIIYMREQGDPIGKVNPFVREERKLWYETHNCFHDKICRNNCLDVCIDYNNKVELFQGR